MANVIPFGFIDLQTLQDAQLQTVSNNVILTAVQQSVAEHTRAVTGALSTLVTTTTELQERYEQLAAEDMQPVTENGRAQPTVTNVTNTVAYPLKRYESAIGTNKETRAKMTLATYQSKVASKINSDARVLMRNLLSCVLDNVTWTYQDEVADLSIKPLANGDGDVYVRRGTAAPASADQYLSQSAGIADATNPFGTIWANLFQFPGNFVSSMNPVYSFVPTNLVGDIEVLDVLIPPAENGVIYNATDVMNQRFDDNLPPFADRFLGTVNGCKVYVWSSLPDNYIFSWATGAGPIIKMREQVNMSGLMTDRHSVDGNLELDYFRRVSGFGAYNRVGGNVMEVSNASDPTYVVPTGFLASSVTGA